MSEQRASVSPRFRVLLVGRTLTVGGAERQLTSLATGLAERGHAVAVHIQRGEVAPAHEAALHGSGVEISIGGYLRALRRARSFRPDIVYGFGPGPNLLASLLCGPQSGRTAVWSILGSARDLANFNWKGRLIYGVESRLSRLPALIIANSTAGVQAALARGMPASSLVLVHNGIDTDHFVPDLPTRRPVRDEWAVRPEQTLIGVVARLHPAKGHATLLRASALLEDPTLRFVMIGSGTKERQKALREVERELDLSSRIIWAGERDDMAAVYSGLDLMCLPSETEGFPNVVGEAMACGVPCVVTDVGDAASIVDDLGFVATPRDDRSLADALNRAITRQATEGREWSQAVRARIVERFSKQAMVAATEQALERALRHRAAHDGGGL